uniref:Uncharacterized protein n=1 Tax=Canis lupus familiaris TaxID=9615 RepID=A0A8C0SCW5_CANLF
MIISPGSSPFTFIFRTDLLPTALHSTAPFLPPRPSRLSQITFFGRDSFLVAPLYKSSKVTEIPSSCIIVPPICLKKSILVTVFHYDGFLLQYYAFYFLN